jgi:hypothetical protein
MWKVLTVLVTASCLWGQNPADLFHKAPPAVDEALRARISKFFQAHVDGKFRLAEPLVAEESKDFFYSTNKPKYLGFEIRDIAYSDDFKLAKATVVTKMVIMAPGFLDKPVPVPVPSRWKLVNGDWYWYVSEDDLNMTPFGKMKAGNGGSGSGSTPAIPGPEEAARLLKAVKPDKDEIELKAREASSGEFTIVNGMPGHVTLSLDPVRYPGVAARIDTTDLEAGAKAHVTVEWTPGAAPARQINLMVRVQPTNQYIRLRARFAN